MIIANEGIGIIPVCQTTHHINFVVGYSDINVCHSNIIIHCDAMIIIHCTIQCKHVYFYLQKCKKKLYNTTQEYILYNIIQR